MGAKWCDVVKIAFAKKPYFGVAKTYLPTHCRAREELPERSRASVLDLRRIAHARTLADGAQRSAAHSNPKALT